MCQRPHHVPLAESPGRAERAWHPTEIRCAPAPAETHADTLRTGTAGPVPCRKEADAAGCQPSAGCGAGKRRQKPRAGQCLVCCVLRWTSHAEAACPESAAPLQRYVIESEREREEGCGDLQVRGVQREREMCCKCSKYVSESEREREEGCGHL